MENETTEHKRSTAELEAAMESVASILNKHDHGELYFGVRPRDGEVIGMGVSEKTLRDISQAFTNRVEPRVYPTTEHLVTEDGKSYVKTSFFGTERPYASQGRYRIRSADEDLPMNAETLERMMLERAERKGPWDGHLSGRPVADADEGALRRFVEEGNACGRIAAPYTDAADALAGLGLIADNGTLSNAAAALFCPSKTGAHLKAGILADRSRVEILDLQQWDGPVYDLISRAEFYVLSNIRRLIIDGSLAREEVPEIPRAAFREAIVNALCHRDWTDYGTAVQIDIYPDTVEVTNPGTFPAGRTTEMYLSDEVVAPKSRNPLIASTLLRSKTIESFGSGIKRIRDTCAEAGVRFEYTQAHGATTVRSHRNDPYDEPLGTDAVPSGSKWFQADDPEAGLSENECTVLAFLRNRDSATALEVAEAAHMGRRGAVKLFGRLAERGPVAAEGSQRTRRYRAAEHG